MSVLLFSGQLAQLADLDFDHLFLHPFPLWVATMETFAGHLTFKQRTGMTVRKDERVRVGVVKGRFVKGSRVHKSH